MRVHIVSGRGLTDGLIFSWREFLKVQVRFKITLQCMNVEVLDV